MNHHNIPELVLKANKFAQFNPMQEECIKKGFEKNLVVSAPTASGKTIVAELFMLDRTLNKNQKVIYTCPLRALASEHYNDFKRKYSAHESSAHANSSKIKFAISTGDLDSSSSYLKKFDVIMTTYEKLASLLRHKSEWLQQVGCIIVDELHELDSDRGPVLEIALTQMRLANPKLNALGLSATIPNAKELAEWLSAELIESDFRPVKLKEGVLLEAETEFKDGSMEKGALEEVVEGALQNNKQLLFFMNARKRAEGNAEKLREIVSKKLSEKNKLKLNELAESALNVLEAPTEQCKSLAESIRSGVAFHHAGLMQRQREIVEESFRKGDIKIISATPTLAAGINSPADIVIIPSLYRFEKYGMNLISVREYKQMSGRSGRPKFSSEGKSIVIANGEDQKELFMEKYINGALEPVLSRLSIIPILRTHILALIATNTIYDLKSIEAFFEKTLYCYQLKELSELLEKVVGIIDSLEEFGFAQKKGDYFTATPIGKRVSDLFLDPESAYELIQALKVKKTFNNFAYLFAWANCLEFSPWFSVPKKAEAIIWEDFYGRMDELPLKKDESLFGPEALNKFFSALMIESWINEKKEQELFSDYGLAPGLLFGKTRILEWMAYSTVELAKVLNLEKHFIAPQKLSKRIKHGVKEELLSLVELKGVGRVRARRLFGAGIKKPSEVKANPAKVEALFGKKVAEQVLGQLKIETRAEQKNLRMT